MFRFINLLATFEKPMIAAVDGKVAARMQQEGAHFVGQLASPEVAEAIGAFFEKRKPDFSKF